MLCLEITLLLNVSLRIMFLFVFMSARYQIRLGCQRFSETFFRATKAGLARCLLGRPPFAPFLRTASDFRRLFTEPPRRPISERYSLMIDLMFMPQAYQSRFGLSSRVANLS